MQANVPAPLAICCTSSVRVFSIRHFEKLRFLCVLIVYSMFTTGVEQARSIAAANLKSAGMEFDKVYCSKLSRSKRTADLILSELECSFLPIVSDWRLNERHYGNLTGVNKRELANKYGEAQVQHWRRNYDGLPPPIETSNLYFYEICNNSDFQNVPMDEFPLTESMRMCVDRVSPVWEEIKKDVLEGTRVLVVVHGTVARALIKHVEGA